MTCAPLVWRLGDGPALHLRRAQTPGISALVVEVASLARARDALAGHGVPVTALTDGLSVVVPGARRLRMILTDTPGVRAENSVRSQARGSNEHA